MAAGTAKKTETGFGTFGGVFTPCTLTILGVILFLRLGQVTGQAGFVVALGILVVSKLITTLTAFSLSSIATNTRVQGGGAYFLISRSLGAEFGGAIGLVFYIAQAISVSMYVVGFTEAFMNSFPGLGLDTRVFGTLVNAAVFACVYIGAGWTIRLQYGILVVLLLSLVSFFAGVLPDASLANLRASATPSYLPGQSAITMFALFFPAVTGIMAGANMSGDLAAPARSIPRGTLAAIGFTALVYAAAILALAASRPQAELVSNVFIMNDIAVLPVLIVAGVFAATISSALGSMMGAPRILQALAKDRIFRRLTPFARGSGAAKEPRRATVLSFAIAEAGVMLGDLDAIAPIITMFFMITYGTLNLACFYESITNNPSYRPRFRLSHWTTAAAGAAGCGIVMFLLEPVWAVIAVAMMFGIHYWIGRTEVRARWGDVASGVAFERARKALLRLEEERYHPKNWRPGILALSGGPWERFHVAEYGHWLAAGRGILTLGHVIAGDVEDRHVAWERAEENLRHFIRDQELDGFAAVVVEEDLLEGVKSLLQSHGLGGLRPNTLLLGWGDDPHSPFFPVLRLARDLRRSILILKCDEEKPRWQTPPGPIDVWWESERQGALMLILAHLLTRSDAWRERPIRLVHAVTEPSKRGAALERLEAVIEKARINATAEVVVAADPAQAAAARAADGAVAFVGFEPPEEGAEAELIARVAAWSAAAPNLLLVWNAGAVSLDA